MRLQSKQMYIYQTKTTSIKGITVTGGAKCYSKRGKKWYPDDILIHILSRLTIKEAAKASILSYQVDRWRYLWAYLLLFLIK